MLVSEPRQWVPPVWDVLWELATPFFTSCGHLHYSAEIEAGDVAHKPPNLRRQPSALSRRCRRRLLTQKPGPHLRFCSSFPRILTPPFMGLF